MLMHIKILIVASFSILLFADYASACLCARRPAPCEAYNSAPAIFIGVVTSIDPARENSDAFMYAHLSVEQSFKGINQPTVKMLQGTGEGDCSIVFAKGMRYLIYAAYSEDTNSFHTNICTRSVALAYAGEDLAYLRGLPASDLGTSLTGTVINHDYEEEGFTSEPELIKGVKITAVGPNGQNFETFTSDDGTYKMSGLPPGTYTVRADVPSYLHVDRTAPEKVVVPGKGCASVGFLTRTDGRIAGVVRNAAGKLAPEQYVDLIPFEMANRLGNRRIGRFTKTDATGKFEFISLRAGRYLIGVNIRSNPEGDNPFPRMFFPGVANAADATVITLGKGEKLNGYDITLPPPLPVSIIRGVLVWPDGKPVTKALIRLRNSAQPRQGEDLAFAEVDQKGRFSLTALEGTEAWIHAGVTIPVEAGIDIMTAEPVRVIAGADRRVIRMVVSKKSPGGVRIIQ